MNFGKSNCYRGAGLLAAALLALNPTAQPADMPVTLKDAFKDDFLVGTAIDRNIASGTSGFRRSAGQSAKDVALVKEQFNQISPENELKWQPNSSASRRGRIRLRRGRCLRELRVEQQDVYRWAHPRLA